MPGVAPVSCNALLDGASVLTNQADLGATPHGLLVIVDQGKSAQGTAVKAAGREAPEGFNALLNVTAIVRRREKSVQKFRRDMIINVDFQLIEQKALLKGHSV